MRKRDLLERIQALELRVMRLSQPEVTTAAISAYQCDATRGGGMRCQRIADHDGMHTLTDPVYGSIHWVTTK